VVRVYVPIEAVVVIEFTAPNLREDTILLLEINHKMNMKNICILFTMMILSLVPGKAMSQEKEDMSFELNSLSGESVRVNLELDDVNEKIILKLNSKEMLCLDNYRGLDDEMKVLNNKFIMIHYKVRGGSDIKVRKTTLVCVADGKLHKALDIVSTMSHNIGDLKANGDESLKQSDECGLYTLKLVSLQHQGRGFLLTAVEHEMESSKADKQNNFEREDSVKMFFDDVNKVFYTKMITLNGRYMVEGESDSLRNFKNLLVPFISLNNEESVYIDKDWYYMEPGNRLAKVTD